MGWRPRCCSYIERVLWISTFVFFAWNSQLIPQGKGQAAQTQHKRYQTTFSIRCASHILYDETTYSLLADTPAAWLSIELKKLCIFIGSFDVDNKGIMVPWGSEGVGWETGPSHKEPAEPTQTWVFAQLRLQSDALQVSAANRPLWYPIEHRPSRELSKSVGETAYYHL